MIQQISILSGCILLLACTHIDRPKVLTSVEKEEFVSIQNENNRTFQSILDSARVEGAILVYDPQTNHYQSNDFEWAAQGRLPASTFKIPNSIIALEEGIMEDENTVLEWDGTKRALSIWEKDMTFAEALRLSCVPCYQEIAQQIGVTKMQDYLQKLHYQSMQFDENTIDDFWLIGASKITLFEQINFLQRLYQGHLPIAAKTKQIIKKMLVFKQTDTYTISGKTGWAMRKNHNNAWFVGYVEKGSKVYYFATNISPKKGFELKDFPKTRMDVTLAALKKLQWLD